MRTFERQTTRRVRFGPILLAAFVLVPLAEIALLIEVGSWIGVWPTLGLIVLSALIGAWMLRREGVGIVARAQRLLEHGAMPVTEVFEGFCLMVAGALLLTPGFITDVVAAVLLLPPIRALLYRRIGHFLERHAASAGGARPGSTNGHGTVVDGDFEELEVGEAPPPRGGWDRRS